MMNNRHVLNHGRPGKGDKPRTKLNASFRRRFDEIEGLGGYIDGLKQVTETPKGVVTVDSQPRIVTGRFRKTYKGTTSTLGVKP